MGHSQADKNESRERILEAAATRIGRLGLNSLGIADIMREAGLTAGAFYGHFNSREHLVSEAVQRMMEKGRAGVAEVLTTEPLPSMGDYLDAYFNESHIRDSAGGCGICALAGEGRFAPPAVREALAEQYELSVGYVINLLGAQPDAEVLARGIMATIVGAVNLARVLPDADSARQIVETARQQILRAAEPS